jgi:hypothetical protein
MIFEILTVVLLLTNIMTLAFLVRASKKKPEKKNLTQDATELLSQLTQGGAVVVTQVIDPATIFQWSPKQ